MGLHPDEVGRFFYPDFARYIEFYNDPKGFLDGYFDRDDAVDKLSTFQSVQQELIRKAEARKQKEKED